VFYPNGCPPNVQLCKRPLGLPKKKLMKAHGITETMNGGREGGKARPAKPAKPASPPDTPSDTCSITPWSPPEGCKSWFDGCNKCGAGVAGQSGCQEKACRCYKEGRCLDRPKPLSKAHGTITHASSSGSQALLITVIGCSLFLLSLFYCCARRKRNSRAEFEDLQLLEET